MASKAEEARKSSVEREKFLRELEAFNENQKEPVVGGPEVVDDDGVTHFFNPQPRSSVKMPPDPVRSKRNRFGFQDVITFCEDPYYLGVTLTPMQRIILKSFYMGSEGNQHLRIDDTQSENCDGCIWKVAKNIEEAIAEMETPELNEEDDVFGIDGANLVRPQGMFPPENLPCLDCTRMCPLKRSKRFAQQKEDAMNDHEIAELEFREHRERQDMFENEWMHIIENNNILEPVRAQVKRKLGNLVTELCLVIGRRSGKALDLNTPILTTKGWKTQGTLVVGDFVFGPDGKPTRVVALSEIWNDRPVYEVTFSNGDTIVADENHEWVTLDQKERKNTQRRKIKSLGHGKVVTTREIADTLMVGRKDDKKQFNHAIAVTSAIQFPEADLPIDPYLMGVWLGDGGKEHGIISSDDAEIIDNIRSIGYEVHKVNSAKFGWRVCKDQNGTAFISQLKTNGFHRNKHISTAYLQSSPSQRLSLLQGIMDTDGCVFKNGHCEITSVNLPLAEQILELICGLGIKAKMGVGDATIAGRFISKKYRICFTPPTGLLVCRLSRKVARLATKNKSDIQRVFITGCRKLDYSVPVRCIQVDNESHLYLAGKTLIPTHNSFLVALIALYTAYRLIKMGNPHKLFRILPGDLITILNVAKSKDQAKDSVFQKIFELLIASPFFEPYEVHHTQTTMYLATPHDLEEYERRKAQGMDEKRGSILILSGHSNSSTLVGKNIVALILDELAEMAGDRGDNGKDVMLYNKMTPSVANFGKEGKIVTLSNPLYEIGKLFSLYNSAFKSDLLLMFQVPTRVVNPTIPPLQLEAERMKDPDNYRMHFEAQFSNGATAPAIPPELVHSAFNAYMERKRVNVGEPGNQYFVHLDPAQNSDNYALAIVHAENRKQMFDDNHQPMPNLVVDHVHLWRPKNKNTPIQNEEVCQYLMKLARAFNIVQFSFDHWHSESAIHFLRQRGLQAVRKQFSPQYQDKIFTNLFDLFDQRRIEFYGQDTQYPDPLSGEYTNLGEITEARKEFLHLTKVIKYGRPKVEATGGHHDDIVDCVAAASYECLNTRVYQELPAPILVYSPYLR